MERQPQLDAERSLRSQPAPDTLPCATARRGEREDAEEVPEGRWRCCEDGVQEVLRELMLTTSLKRLPVLVDGTVLKY